LTSELPLCEKLYKRNQQSVLSLVLRMGLLLLCTRWNRAVTLGAPR